MDEVDAERANKGYSHDGEDCSDECKSTMITVIISTLIFVASK